ncbi:MAG: Rieske (2Fe-2S) protein [Candidatus Aureabacteria bacterium]|nr:Rieske (2Fe-2S) protein [Candidatus Auribacterota bacterium]
MNRRRFFSRLVKLVLGGLAFFVKPPPSRAAQPVFDLEHIRVYPPGTVTHLIIQEAFIVSDREGIYALSSICTHQGGPIFKTDKNDAFVCKRHHARFDLEGNVVRGPATRALPWLRLDLSREKRLILYRAQAGEKGVKISHADGRKIPTAVK